LNTSLASRLLTVAISGLALASITAPASAGNLILEAPQIDVVRPLAGTQTFFYNALVDVGGNEIVESFSAFDPFKANGANLTVSFTPEFNAFVDAAVIGEDYNGPLLQFDLSSGTELGLYNLDSTLQSLANLQVTFTDFDVDNTDTEDYAINVIEGQGGVAAPEPGALALLAPTLLAGAVVLRRR
jgi:hypothetical protein